MATILFIDDEESAGLLFQAHDGISISEATVSLMNPPAGVPGARASLLKSRSSSGEAMSPPKRPAVGIRAFNEPWREALGLERPRGANTQFIYGFGKTEECLHRLFEWPNRTRWIIELEKSPHQTTNDRPQLATIRLFPGVSIKEARKAAETAVRQLGQLPAGRRPPIPSTVLTALHTIFESVAPEINRRGIRKLIVDQCESALKRTGKPISRSRLQNELLRWLRLRKFPVKSYVRS